jgi:hypothetical protein
VVVVLLVLGDAVLLPALRSPELPVPADEPCAPVPVEPVIALVLPAVPLASVPVVPEAPIDVPLPVVPALLEVSVEPVVPVAGVVAAVEESAGAAGVVVVVDEVEVEVSVVLRSPQAASERAAIRARAALAIGFVFIRSLLAVS